jgi:hypothetical protein
VTKEDVQRVANKYLVTTNRTVVVTIPKTEDRDLRRPGSKRGEANHENLNQYISCRGCRSRFLACLWPRPSPARARLQQQGQSIKGADIKGRAPVNKEILKVNLPKGQEATLSNGLRVIVLENHRVPTFTMQMVVLSGGLSDPAGLSWAVKFHSGAVARRNHDAQEQRHRGTGRHDGRYSHGRFGSRKFYKHGHHLGAGENFDQALGLFSDVILHPNDFRRKKSTNTKLASFSNSNSSARFRSFLAQERFVRAIYGTHPAGMITAPIGLDQEDRVSGSGRFSFEVLPAEQCDAGDRSAM